jgi:putative membrane protein
MNRTTGLIMATSIAVPLLVAALFLMPEKSAEGQWVKMLPHVNAIINSLTALLLVAGLTVIRNGNKELHRAFMLAAFLLGAAFLVSYVVYHASAPSTPYGGTGVNRYVYYFILISHILLSIGVVPLVLLALYRALTGNFAAHKKIAQYAWPVWLYVSVTGVAVYLMIRPYY